MATKFDLMSIYGIPPARYDENNPDDLFLEGLPSLEQIASYNLANAGYVQPMNNSANSSQGMIAVPNVNGSTATPATLYGGSGNDFLSTVSPNVNTQQLSASGELPGSLPQLITDYSKPYPVTAESIQYLNGFIRTQIGRRAQIQFLMGNAELIEKDGFLLGVGANYILINEIGTNDITACDFYNIKFIRFLY